MRRTLRAGLVAISSAGVLLAGIGAAYAHHTKVSVAGSTAGGVVAYSAENDTPEVSFITEFGVEMRCSIATIDGDINRGADVVVPDTVASIDSLVFDDCWMGTFPLQVTMTGATIDVRNHPGNAGDPVDVVITEIDANIATTNPNVPCSFNARGTLDAVIEPGDGANDALLRLVPAEFDGPFAVSGFDLEISDVYGCGGEIRDDDLAGAFYYDEPNGVPSSFAVDSSGLITHN